MVWGFGLFCFLTVTVWMKSVAVRNNTTESHDCRHFFLESCGSEIHRIYLQATGTKPTPSPIFTLYLRLLSCSPSSLVPLV